MNSKQLRPYLNRFHPDTGIYDEDHKKQLSDMDRAIRQRILAENEKESKQ